MDARTVNEPSGHPPVAVRPVAHRLAVEGQSAPTARYTSVQAVAIIVRSARTVRSTDRGSRWVSSRAPVSCRATSPSHSGLRRGPGSASRATHPRYARRHVTASTAAVEYTHPETGIVYRATTNAGGAAPNIGRQVLDELNGITGQPGVDGTVPVSISSYTDGTPIPNWYTAKKNLDAALQGTDQGAYDTAIAMFNHLNYLVGYRIDLIGDVRLFRKLLLLP